MPMPSSAPSQHLKGIACILTGVLCLTCSDALAKALGASYPALQLLFMRAALAAPVLALALLLTSGASGLRTQHIGKNLQALFVLGQARRITRGKARNLLGSATSPGQ